jgi:hypothetical protein
MLKEYDYNLVIGKTWYIQKWLSAVIHREICFGTYGLNLKLSFQVYRIDECMRYQDSFHSDSYISMIDAFGHYKYIIISNHYYISFLWIVWLMREGPKVFKRFTLHLLAISGSRWDMENPKMIRALGPILLEL